MANPSTSGPLLIGQTFDTFRIVGKVGSGGMGEVYKAEDLKLSRTVALKLLPHNLHASERSRELFLQEARSASTIDHPNIGTIHSVGESIDGRLFIVMAFYEGETLGAKIARCPLPPAQAIEFASQMTRGLSEAHGHNIVHRDVKPANVIITRQGLVKIVDFGLARVIQSAQSTASTALSGTAAYMSPEQARGTFLDHRTDLWSVGVCLYQMVTGRLPFEGESVPAQLYRIVHAAPPPLEGVPAELQAIVYRALAKDPAQRYQTAGEMLADLEAAASPSDALPTRAHSARRLEQYVANASAPDQPRNRWRGSRRLLLLSAVAMLLLGAFVIFVGRGRLMPGTSAARHLAVLPITSRDADAASVALADGLMESLTARVSNFDVGQQSVWVVPASEVRRRKVEDAASARKEFGATLVVNGSLQRQGSALRLIVNLIETKDLRQIGSAEVDAQAGDYASLQDAAVGQLARLMNIRAARESGGAAAKPAAYESYLKGLGLLQRYDRPGNLDQAVATLETATRSDPQFALAFASLGEAYYLKYQTDQTRTWLDRASAECRRAVGLNDRLAPVHVILGRVLVAQGQVDLALEEFQRALDLNPRGAEALAGVARVYETQGRIKEAEEAYRRATVLRPDYWDGYNSLGQFYLRERRFSDAVVQFQKVVELTPDNANGYLNLGAALTNDRRLPEAIQAIKRSLSIAPTYGAHTNLGNIYFREQHWQEAAREYQEAVKLNDQDFRPWLNLANSYRHLNRADDAKSATERGLPLVEKLAASRPQDAQLQSILGSQYAYAGQREKAISRLEAAVAIAPADAGVLSRVGDAYERLGDRARAVDYINRALASGYALRSLQDDPEMRGIITDPRFKAPPN